MRRSGIQVAHYSRRVEHEERDEVEDMEQEAAREKEKLDARKAAFYEKFKYRDRSHFGYP